MHINLGNKLKQHRLNQHLTAKELLEKAGVSSRTITGFEKGEKNVSLLNLIEILRTLRLINNLSDFPIECLNSSIRKYSKSKTIFPDDKSALKAIYSSIINIQKKWSQPISNWGIIFNQMF